MNLSSSIRVVSSIALVCIFLVILAGSVVRTTGSGMGCPDWPKCFGYLVPPTDPAVLQYVAERKFEKNQMVILNDTLWVANESITAPAEFDHSQWHKYPRHNYAIFNPTHTWTEYINRLLGATSGIPVLILFVLATLRLFRHKDAITFALAFGVLLMLGFEAWLGKVVVDEQLKESTITLHMMGSMLIAALLVALISRFGEKPIFPTFGRSWKLPVIALLFLLIAQVLLGTQVRQEIDVIAKANDFRSEWIGLLPPIFMIHRSFSIILVLLVLAIYRLNSKLPNPLKSVKLLAGLLLLEVLAGVALSYLGMPKAMQPVHLLSAIGMFSVAMYISIIVWRRQIVC
ncbi:MAG: hypothetical protein RL018_438 [Pseudomonadota bacterium]|jgi:cytochrome c oxidase assembly protein subunit 15